MIVGIDYSTKYVHLAWNLGGWNYPRIKVEEDLGEFLFNLNDILPSLLEEDGHIYIERPWARYNVQTGMLMQRIATVVDVVATQAGYETHWVAIAAWRSLIFGKGTYKTKIAKQLAIAKVKEVMYTEVDDNTADAICLALYGQQARLES